MIRRAEGEKWERWSNMPENVDPKSGKTEPEGLLATLQASVEALTGEVKELRGKQEKADTKTASLWEKLFG
jgi:predicted acyltransferase